MTFQRVLFVCVSLHFLHLFVAFLPNLLLEVIILVFFCSLINYKKLIFLFNRFKKVLKYAPINYPFGQSIVLKVKS